MSPTQMRGETDNEGERGMIQINAAARLPPKMAHGTTFHHRSGRARASRSRPRSDYLRAVFHFGNIMKAGVRLKSTGARMVAAFRSASGGSLMSREKPRQC